MTSDERFTYHFRAARLALDEGELYQIAKTMVGQHFEAGHPVLTLTVPGGELPKERLDAVRAYLVKRGYTLSKVEVTTTSQTTEELDLGLFGHVHDPDGTIPDTTDR